LGRIKLDQLKQKARIEDYTAEFINITLGIHDIGEGEKLHLYVRGLKEQVRAWVLAALPQSFDQAARIAQQIDSVSPIQHQHYNNQQHPQPMELGTIRFTKLTPEEKLQLQQKGHCFYCRKPGHFAKNSLIKRRR